MQFTVMSIHTNGLIFLYGPFATEGLANQFRNEVVDPNTSIDHHNYVRVLNRPFDQRWISSDGR